MATCAFHWKLRKRCRTGRCSDLEAQSTESIINCVLRQISNSPRCRKRSAGKVWGFSSHTRNSLCDMSYRTTSSQLYIKPCSHYTTLLLPFIFSPRISRTASVTICYDWVLPEPTLLPLLAVHEFISKPVARLLMHCRT